jgi:hypothetical protein
VNFDQQRMRPAAEVRSRDRQGRGGWEIKNGGLCFARSETSCSLGCKRGSSYHSPMFCLIMMKVGAEDQELGQSIGLLAASCWQGALCRAGSSGSCGALDGAFTVVFPGGFGEVDIPGGTTG